MQQPPSRTATSPSSLCCDLVPSALGLVLSYSTGHGREESAARAIQFDSLDVDPLAIGRVITSDNYGKLKKKTASRVEGTSRHRRDIVPDERMRRSLATCATTPVALRDCGLESAYDLVGNAEADVCHMSLRALFLVGVLRFPRVRTQLAPAATAPGPSDSATATPTASTTTTSLAKAAVKISVQNLFAYLSIPK